MIDATMRDVGRTVLWRGGPPDHHRLFAVLVGIDGDTILVRWNNGTRSYVTAETLSWAEDDEVRA